MKTIDLATWNRREHFSFFRRMDLPFYNVNVRVEITGLKEFSKAQGVSLNTIFIDRTVRALNRVENFRYRLRGGEVILHDRIHPSFAHLKPGEDLFRLVTVDHCNDLAEFDRAVRREIEASSSYFPLEKLAGRDDLVFLSSLPWIAFSAIDHTLNLNKDDAVPRISWGKVHTSNGKAFLPYNVQVNHCFVDGIHVARFFEALDHEIEQARTGCFPGTVTT